MKQISIGQSTWQASAIAFGNWRMAEVPHQQAIEIIEALNESGINFIDSADIYGGGEAERVLGKALADSSLNRDLFYIQSKVGIDIANEDRQGYGKRFNFRKDYILSAVDGILERLGIEHLDSLLLHRPDALMNVYEVAEAFESLHHAGKVRYFGVSNFSDRQIDWLQANLQHPLMINQLQFSLMHTPMLDHGFNYNRLADDAINYAGGSLEYSLLNKITVQAWSPFQISSGAGSFIDNPDYPEVNLKLGELADKYSVEKNTIAAAWILKHPANIQVITGSMTPDRIRSTAKAGDIEITDQEWYNLYLSTGKRLP